MRNLEKFPPNFSRCTNYDVALLGPTAFLRSNLSAGLYLGKGEI